MMSKIGLGLLVLFVIESQSLPFIEKSTCGYKSCTPTDPLKLNIHLIPHTHDDVGWLKTVDQYYYGNKNRIQRAGVQYIIDSVVKELWEDPKRRFIYVETAFFWRWWTKQSEKTKQKVQTLVNEGRLEFIGGAWSMNDEANVYYQSTIDQFTRGLRKLNATFGECGRPRIAWQIDPFGHSKEFASLVSQMGYDGLFHVRIDYQDKAQRLKEKRMEVIWQTNEDLGNQSNLYTGILYDHYSAPSGFCFDVRCSDDPIVDDEESPDYNVETKVSKFVSFVKNVATKYLTNNVLITMGDDFTYQMAQMWYTNLDLLIKYTNEISERDGLGVNVFYSTPSCYMKAVQESKPTLPTKQGDFFPYASDSHAYWTGYFTSRPTSKYFERVGNRFFQMAKQLQVTAALSNDNDALLDELGNAMGIMQHHDAVTGTEKQAVANDYHRMLDHAIQDAMAIPRQAISKITLDGKMDQPELNFERCQLNISSCNIGDRVIVSVYNSLSWAIDTPVRLPVDGKYLVYDKDGNEVTTDLIKLPDAIKNIQLRDSDAETEILFIAKAVPALGLRNFYIIKQGDGETEEGVEVDKVTGQSDTTGETRTEEEFISNEQMKITFDPLTGKTTKMILADGTTIPFEIEFLFYPGAIGSNDFLIDRSSGAYIFRPNATSAFSIESIPSYHIYKAQNCEEIHVSYADYISAVIRLYKDDPYLELDWIVGPIPIYDGVGKEIIVRYNTNLSNADKFYTDSNGRQTIERVLNQRIDYNLKLYEPIAGNYYPVNGRISIKDRDLELFVLNDRPQGGSSLNEGQVEVMLHRRLLHDDGKGVGEALNEAIDGIGLVVRGKHHIRLVKDESKHIKKKSLEILLEPHVFVADLSNRTLDEFKDLKNEWSAVYSNNIPENVHILTVEPWSDTGMLLRFEYYLEIKDGATGEISFKLNDIFSNITIKGVRETMLAANLWLNDYEQTLWNVEDESDNNNLSLISSVTEYNGSFMVVLKPMQIVSMIIDYEV